jgi:molybdopterin-guanine dinucleotide biosynthesis protein A
VQTRVLILAGGESRRMGQPKGLLNYHGQPQVHHLHNLATSLQLEAFISCREEQKPLYADLPVILDRAEFSDHGPISGLLSAFHTLQGNWLLLGCDYPNLDKTTITSLLMAEKEAFDVVCYKHPDSSIPEPLIAFYTHSAGNKLLDFFNQGNDSLSRFIRQCNTCFLDEPKALVLKSVDTPQERDAFITRKHE